jgi:chromosomal replication initiator protein
MYLARRLTGKSLQEIGRAFGGRDHSTVLHACEKIARELSENGQLRDLVERISGELVAAPQAPEPRRE